MLKKILTTTLLLSLMGYASMPTVNYDEQFDDAEMENINEHIVDDTLLGLDLQSLTFQEMTVKTPDGKEEQKNVSVKKVKAGEKVVYINRLINQTGQTKQGIIVKNPIPQGTRYVHGSAICDKGCTISYSSNQGTTLDKNEDTHRNYDYLEFHFYQIAPNSEVRMGFRAVIE